MWVKVWVVVVGVGEIMVCGVEGLNMQRRGCG